MIRSALGTAAPAFAICIFVIQPVKPFPSSGLGGAFVSATSTSPFGSTYSQRGCASPCANAFTVMPDATFGLAPAGQPRAVAISTVGISDFFGAGSVGVGPMPDSTGRSAFSRQAAGGERQPQGDSKRVT